MKNVSGYIISINGDESVGIKNQVFELTGDFLFYNEEEETEFLNNLGNMFSEYSGEKTKIDSVDELKKKEEAFYKEETEYLTNKKFQEEMKHLRTSELNGILSRGYVYLKENKHSVFTIEEQKFIEKTLYGDSGLTNQERIQKVTLTLPDLL